MVRLQHKVVSYVMRCIVSYPSDLDNMSLRTSLHHAYTSAFVCCVVQMSSVKGSWRTKTPMTAGWAAALVEGTPGRCQGLSTRQPRGCHWRTLAAAAIREQRPATCPHRCDHA
jgi:hypothetical protein